MARKGWQRLFPEQDESYPGNIWGWKVSLIGAAVLILLLGLMIYRHITLDVPFGSPDGASDEPRDTTLNRTTEQDDHPFFQIPGRR